jgi:hypothetical protein
MDATNRPELYKETFPYTSLPRMHMTDETVPINIPENMWMTDTTFRDGQQAREPYTVDQVVSLYDYMHRLSGPDGVIRFTEFFLYNARDREALIRCQELGYEFPKITSWIRAKKEDLELVKKVDVEETGILSSLSDYHIFYKFGWDREKTIANHLSVAEECLKQEIIPRCHIEDCTRADIQNVVVPFIQRLMKLSEEYGMPTKVRVCDTLGLGVPYPEAALPRSVPKIMNARTHTAEQDTLMGSMGARLVQGNNATQLYQITICDSRITSTPTPAATRLISLAQWSSIQMVIRILSSPLPCRFCRATRSASSPISATWCYR